jgi:hypothetical protein
MTIEYSILQQHNTHSSQQPREHSQNRLPNKSEQNKKIEITTYILFDKNATKWNSITKAAAENAQANGD